MPDQQPFATPATRVLCVGADTYLTDLLRYALTREGCVVQVAASGGGAFAVAERWSPHAAILDGDSPGLGGDALAAHLLERYRIPAVLLTADDRDEERAGGPMRGARHHLEKPFSLRALVDALHTMVQTGSAARGG